MRVSFSVPLLPSSLLTPEGAHLGKCLPLQPGCECSGQEKALQPWFSGKDRAGGVTQQPAEPQDLGCRELGGLCVLGAPREEQRLGSAPGLPRKMVPPLPLPGSPGSPLHRGPLQCRFQSSPLSHQLFPGSGACALSPSAESGFQSILNFRLK